MLLYYLFWMLMGFILHFYIIFGTNLLTGGPTQIDVFLPILEFRRKGISNGVQTEWNLRERYFWNKRDPGDLEWTSEMPRGGHEVGGRAQGVGMPPPSWAPRSSTNLLLPPIYIHIPRKHPGAPRNPIFHRRNLLYPRDPILGPFPELRRRGHWWRRASTSTPWPLRWCVSSLLQTFGSIASS